MFLRSLLPCNSQISSIADVGLSHGCYQEIFLSSCCVSGVIESWGGGVCAIGFFERVPHAPGPCRQDSATLGSNTHSEVCFTICTQGKNGNPRVTEVLGVSGLFFAKPILTNETRAPLP